MPAIVGAAQRQQCYKIADQHVLGKRLIKPERRKRIMDRVIDQFQKQIALDPDNFTSSDKDTIKKSVIGMEQADEAAEMGGRKAFLSFILTTVIGWLIQKALEYLWDWWKNRNNKFAV